MQFFAIHILLCLINMASLLSSDLQALSLKDLISSYSKRPTIDSDTLKHSDTLELLNIWKLLYTLEPLAILEHLNTLEQSSK